MVVCKNCNIPMIWVMSFSKEKHERFCRCPRCYSESKHKKISDDDLDFGEYLHREMKKERKIEEWIFKER